MNTSLFPDLNVWLASVHKQHPHYEQTRAWLDALPSEYTLVICRTTQLGLLRLLTTRAAMGEEVLTQADAWGVLDGLMADSRTLLAREPDGLWFRFRTKTERHQISPKVWADAYLAAFAEGADLQLVTLDRALAGSVSGSILLG